MAKVNSYQTQPPREKAFLVGVSIDKNHVFLRIQESLDELAFLAQTANLDVVGKETQQLAKPNPATYIGKGKVNEIKILAENAHADIVIFDNELSPRNFRELELAFGNNLRILDRTTLILDIFGQHAQSHEGKLQVELAQYEYILPRLTRAWSHLARQSGGGGGRTGNSGGVGLRGPGETQLEVDRRRIRQKINRLKNDLEKVRHHRQRHRKKRKASSIPIIAIVGYTNAGKSTLLNRLTKSDVLVANKLFATLDPTTRRLSLPSGNNVLITDTVGFIQKLPAHLIAAFRATLEEITEADLLLHVVDINDVNAYAKKNSVLETLREIGAGNIPLLTVFNKIDLTNGQIIKILKDIPLEDSVKISAAQNLGIDCLLDEIDRTLFRSFTPIDVKIPYKNGRLISLFHQFGKVNKVEHGFGEILISGSIPGRLLADFERFITNKES